MPYEKHKDPYCYVKAQDFFTDLDSGNCEWRRVASVELHPDQFGTDGNVAHDICLHGRAFRDRDDPTKIFLVQFVRPTVFRIRFNPEHIRLSDYSDRNSQNLVQNTLTELISTLDRFEGISWEVNCKEEDDYIMLESRFKGPSNHRAYDPPFCNNYYMRIYILKRIFRIVAVKPVQRHMAKDQRRLLEDIGLHVSSPEHIPDTKIVWQSKARGILYRQKATVIEVEKPGTARYLGFGEQGGRQLLKTKVIVDYFNYDNMTCSQVYNRGPLDSREPLYHSEPFWMEFSQHPGYASKVASFVDNFSQVCLDIGSKDNSTLRVATRFNSMHLFVVAGNSVSEVITSYTSIVGRPRLKPRYVLGYHQGCYGYDSPKKILDVVEGYRNAGFPLDGLHIDVDFQRDHKTFTIDEERFPNPGDFLRKLKAQGIKCGTNITPFINGDEDQSYQTLQEGLQNDYFVKDKRYLDAGGPSSASDDRYMLFRGGSKHEFPACDLAQEPRCQYDPPDQTPLSETWNTGKSFRGGVWYGGNLGRPGYYPDLNRLDVQVWWGNQYERLISLGLEFVWQDMTSPCMGASYGDMRSFPFRLLLSSNATRAAEAVRNGTAIYSKDKESTESKAREASAIEIWALYSLNLHRATYKGWNRSKGREGKRNFIIGRGGFIGLHRYAGLWTGDNASQWDFLKVSVAQVLSLGLSGITISGGDVGGFEPSCSHEEWANPELVMRWYCAYSLLPWFRNHYNGKPGKKRFQEPFRYAEQADKVPNDQKWLYHATLPICRYYVRFRYSLLQLLYDQMFDNLLTGLPIARSLVISNEDDASLLGENADFLDDEYMVGDDFLVAPVLHAQGQEWERITRTVYLPRPDSWWQCNLRAEGPEYAVPLGHEFKGGSLIPYDARMSLQESHIPYMTPMFVRFGAILPQIEPRMYTEDHTKPNPISIHVYPGHHELKRSYDMYLDDGVSRNSAPTATGLQESFAANSIFKSPYDPRRQDESKLLTGDAFGDEKADDVYWKIRIWQDTNHDDESAIIPGQAKQIVRDIFVETVHQNAGFDPRSIHGQSYRFVIWGEPKRETAFQQAEIRIFTLCMRGTKEATLETPHRYDSEKRAWLVELPIRDVALSSYQVQCIYNF